MTPILLTYKKRRSEMMKLMVNEQAKALSMKPYPSKRRRTDDNGSISESTNNHEAQSLLELLPPELFCHALSFVGPASTTLLAIAKVNQFFRGTMTAIGNAMLPRAQAHFRITLVPKSPMESSSSLFIRHARICSQVLCDLTQLRSMLLISPTENDSQQVEHAMEMALKLLQIGPSLSLSLERQILSTCGKCGGKAFKYSKWMLTQCSSESEKYINVEPRLLKKEQALSVENQSRLDTSRCIMQAVVLRDLELTKQQPTLITGSSLRPILERATLMPSTECCD